VLAAAVVSAGLGWRWRRAQRQAAIVAALESTGVASVMYDYQVHTSGDGDWGQFTIVPRFVRERVGEDFFSDVHVLRIGGSANAPAPADGWKEPLGPRAVSLEKCRETLRLAAPLRKVRWLWIEDAVVRRDELAQLSCWEQLTDLQIDGCDVRDEDLAPLARAVNVVNLDLNRQPIGDEALAHLRNMRKLKRLGLGATSVTDEGLAELDNFPELQVLWLFGLSGISDLGMVPVGRCRELRFLELSGSGVGDVGLKELAHFQDLHYLNAGKTSVTDAGLKHLSHLTKLEEGLFYGTSVTHAGIDQVPSLVASKKYSVGLPSRAAAITAGQVAAP
jgi:hypothetical protein